MEDKDDPELLNLSLAIVSSDSNGENSKKRKRIVNVCRPAHEGKVFMLLQVREEMLKLEEHGNKRENGGKGLHLIHSLLLAATSVDKNNMNSALDSLVKLYQSVSLTGDSVQRVVAYFANGLFARILTPKSPFYNMIMKEPTDEQQFLAVTCLYKASPYYQFAHFTANQAIIEAFEKNQKPSMSRTLHVIDFDVSYGFQWPSLIQSLSETAASTGKRISLKLTGYGRSFEELHETETRLASFAKGFHNVVFEFQGLLRGSKLIIKENEIVAVNLVLHFDNNFLESDMSETLRSVHSLRPSIVILVEQEGNNINNPRVRSFLPRFVESLHYFAAMFDSLDDCLPQESNERLSIEKNHFGKLIKAMININEFNRGNKAGTWKKMMESHGFEGVKLSSKCLMQAKLLLKIRTHNHCPFQRGDINGGFRVFQKDEGKALSLGWQDRCLLTASAWQCV
ncbi:SCARECROW-LIKE 23 [Hibiscus trionum]|uniref:SCARECROW-LIKE 23 n=1 Tax=Hibiscus trionum TaxID=183268 RepID=A0A9W7MJN3_HIBTR|nr:SCARECROW-LIKE 23 [Hibiscus trionum]